jgi:hypothetical protein
MFVSAFLLFWVQPMFSKMVLPLLGGSPAVWNTCMVFYQAALLAGYTYAHTATRWLGVRRQAVFHLALLALIIFSLPIGLAHGWTPPAAGSPIAWLFLVLLVSVGLPFFVISTTAPMLQKWFAHSGHPAAHDPYFLYGASNLGSLMALLGYPVFLEPYLRLADQSWAWAGGYLGLLALIAVCAVMLWRAPAASGTAMAQEGPASPGETPAAAFCGSLTLGSRLWWVLLAFAPSSLLLGVTTYLSTDIAAVPLLWVVPLAIYLLTFVLVFARKPLVPHRLTVLLEPYFVIAIALTFFLQLTGAWQFFLLHLVTFFLLAMVCHGELMQLRPGASHLTEFYLWMSVGGVLGGLFNALVAPMTFRAVIEYPLVIVVACLLRPYLTSGAWRPYRLLLDFLLPLALFGLLGGLIRLLPDGGSTLQWFGLSCAAIVLCFSFRKRPVRFGLGIGAVMLAGVWFTPNSSQILFQERDFFGVLQVKQDLDRKFHLLTHGTTLHGAQSQDPASRRKPLTYYSRSGPLGQVFAALSEKGTLRRIAVIGLGTGTVACYGQPGQHLTFYEIDPAVERIARNPHYFTFLKDCPAEVQVVLGDGRLSLQQAPDAGYDLIILDAFSSDAIPVHLLTREALRLYLAKLKKSGILAFHITNRYLDLRPVVGDLAREAGLSCLIQSGRKLSEEDEDEYQCASTWVIMARDVQDLGRRLTLPRWHPLPGRPGEALWTDDFSNILTVCDWESFDLKESWADLLEGFIKGWSVIKENLVSLGKRG